MINALELQGAFHSRCACAAAGCGRRYTSYYFLLNLPFSSIIDTIVLSLDTYSRGYTGTGVHGLFTQCVHVGHQEKSDAHNPVLSRFSARHVPRKAFLFLDFAASA
jgi:hypothetical protein